MYTSRTVRSTRNARVRMCGMVTAVRTVRTQNRIVGNVVKIGTAEPRASESRRQLLQVVGRLEARDKTPVRALEKSQLI
jgi:hypothetical protein